MGLTDVSGDSPASGQATSTDDWPFFYAQAHLSDVMPDRLALILLLSFP
jgi:hypothetical protein